jgi:hypothetical protein
MGYYQAGDYYRGDYYRGDNYATGGIFGTIGKFLGGVAKTVIGATPVGRVVQAAIPSFNPPVIRGFAPPLAPTPGLTGFAERLLPGGASGYMVRRRRRINPLNIKALRRAMRRAKGFEKQAKRVGSFFSPGKTYRLKGRSGKRRA